MPKRHPGFTLIELAIVLVIIGLVVGGVLVGKDLINAAETRATVGQFADINAAANTYRLLYRYLPGDMTGPGAYQKNGFVDGLGNAQEAPTFYLELKNAGLLNCEVCNGAYRTFHAGYTPTAAWMVPKLGRGIILPYGGLVSTGCAAAVPSGVHYLEIYSPWDTAPIMPLTPSHAQALDDKMDDGMPLTGQARAQSYSVGAGACGYAFHGLPAVDTGAPRTPTSGAAGSANCVSTSTTPNSYNITYGSYACQLQVRASF